MSPRPIPVRHLQPDAFTAELAQLEGFALLAIKCPDPLRLILEIEHVDRVGPAIASDLYKSGADSLTAARLLAVAFQRFQREARAHLWRLLTEQAKAGNASAIGKLAEFADDADTKSGLKKDSEHVS